MDSQGLEARFGVSPTLSTAVVIHFYKWLFEAPGQEEELPSFEVDGDDFDNGADLDLDEHAMVVEDHSADRRSVPPDSIERHIGDGQTESTTDGPPAFFITLPSKISPAKTSSGPFTDAEMVQIITLARHGRSWRDMVDPSMAVEIFTGNGKRQERSVRGEEDLDAYRRRQQKLSLPQQKRIIDHPFVTWPVRWEHLESRSDVFATPMECTTTPVSQCLH
jgi:hypothetical protein